MANIYTGYSINVKLKGPNSFLYLKSNIFKVCMAFYLVSHTCNIVFIFMWNNRCPQVGVYIVLLYTCSKRLLRYCVLRQLLLFHLNQSTNTHTRVQINIIFSDYLKNRIYIITEICWYSMKKSLCRFLLDVTPRRGVSQILWCHILRFHSGQQTKKQQFQVGEYIYGNSGTYSRCSCLMSSQMRCFL